MKRTDTYLSWYSVHVTWCYQLFSILYAEESIMMIAVIHVEVLYLLTLNFQGSNISAIVLEKDGVVLFSVNITIVCEE